MKTATNVRSNSYVITYDIIVTWLVLCNYTKYKDGDWWREELHFNSKVRWKGTSKNALDRE